MSQSRRLTVAVVLVLVVGALALPAAASAAVLEKGAGTTCVDGIGTWTFVNNQTGGAAAGFLDLTLVDGNGVQFLIGGSPNEVNRGTQKWTFTTTPDTSAAWTLVSASTNLPGKLILARFECAPVG